MEEQVRAATLRFDTEIVFTLQLVGRELPAIPILAACSNLSYLSLSRNRITQYALPAACAVAALRVVRTKCGCQQFDLAAHGF